MEERRRTLFGSAFVRSAAGYRADGFAACAGLFGTKDQKHNEGGNDNANDDVDQDRAGKARSLLRRRDRRFHARLDADGGWAVVRTPRRIIELIRVEMNAAGLMGIQTGQGGCDHAGKGDSRRCET